MVTEAGNPPRPEELFAYAVIARTLGIAIEHHDTGRQPAMVDGHFALRDGRTGAVEVTTLAAEGAMQTEGEVPKWNLEVRGVNWDWHVNIGPGLRRNDIYHHLEQLIPRCEQQGILHLDHMNPLPDLLDSFTWYINNDIEVGATDTTSNSGRIFLVPGPALVGPSPTDLTASPRGSPNGSPSHASTATSPSSTTPDVGNSTCFCACTRLGSRSSTSTTSPGNRLSQPNRSTHRPGSRGFGWRHDGSDRSCTGPPTAAGTEPTTTEAAVGGLTDS